MPDVWVAGVDGCRGGWAAVFRPASDATQADLNVFETFADILQDRRNPRIIAVDMPIGLPERIGHGGRGPEAALRPLLGARRSSVFSVPSRKAVYTYEKGYPACCEIAFDTSEPGRKISQQAFHLFPKIQEIDGLLRRRSDLVERVFECHPEGSFRMMRGDPLKHPKKLGSGLAERRQLLGSQGYIAAFLEAPPPPHAGRDDVLDACAAAWTAARIASNDAQSWPTGEPLRDEFGLPIAIWT